MECDECVEVQDAAVMVPAAAAVITVLTPVTAGDKCKQHLLFGHQGHICRFVEL